VGRPGLNARSRADLRPAVPRVPALGRRLGPVPAALSRHTGLVPLTVAAAAVRAAVSVAAGLGVACAEPRVLADGANVVVHLSPSPVVAKVAASTAAVRADGAAWLQRELDVALFLARAGVPVMAPSSEVPPVAQHAEGHVMSFWTYLEPSGTGLAGDATIGSMLRDLHAALRSCPGSPPVLAPLGDIPAFLARPQTTLSPADAAALAEAFTRLTAQLDAAAAAQVLHGDAGAGNLMAAGGGWVWHDFEDTCTGPVAWDLAASTANPRRDRARILAAYGEPVDPALLEVCEQLRRLHLTVWYCLYAERLPGCRQRAAELLAAWRT
jgi:Ser/Thr protein kinase RdoA (MazF antagonist)